MKKFLAKKWKISTHFLKNNNIFLALRIIINKKTYGLIDSST
jgi:hypothetical protein